MAEFKLVAAKVAYSLDELTTEERSYICQHIEHVTGEPCEENVDFFQFDDWMVDDVSIRVWSWGNYTLIDVNGWPGDTEDGSIFLNGKIIAENGDRELLATEECPEILLPELETLEQLRPNGDLDLENIPPHLHHNAREVHRQWCQFRDRACTCTACQ